MQQVAQRDEYNHCIDRVLAAAIIAKVPFIGVDYENTDKETAIKMLKNIPRDLKRDLWHFRMDKEGETFIEKYTAGGEFKLQKHGSMENALENNYDEETVVQERIEKAVSGDKALMFDSQEIGGTDIWMPIIIDCIEKAAKSGCTIIILDDMLSVEIEDEEVPSAFANRLARYGVMGKLAHPSEEELEFYLKQYLKKSKWKHPVKNKSIPIELSDGDIKKIASMLIGSNIIEAQKKLACLIADHLIESNCEKIDSSIISNFSK